MFAFIICLKELLKGKKGEFSTRNIWDLPNFKEHNQTKDFCGNSPSRIIAATDSGKEFGNKTIKLKCPAWVPKVTELA